MAQVLCYLRGTRILMPVETRPVEALRIGDAVVTRFAGVQRIKWIGRQSYDPRFLQRNPDKMPVCIKAGALGDATPARDLYVSPGHSLLLESRLVLASALVNGVTITQSMAGLAGQIDYFQIELEAHDCVLAEGAWAESFADAPGLRAQFHHQAEFWARYPDYVTPDALALCAPRPERGPALGVALREVVALAGRGLGAGWLDGALDLVSSDLIEGWAMDVSHPDLPVMLDIWDGDVRLDSVLACDARADLRAAGKGRGYCAFSYRPALPLRAEVLKNLRVTRAGGAAELRRGTACRGIAA